MTHALTCRRCGERRSRWRRVGQLVVGLLCVVPYTGTIATVTVPSGHTIRLDAETADTNGGVVTIPCQLVDGLILLQAEVDGHRGTLLLDTGSPTLVLNSAYVTPGDSATVAHVMFAATGAVPVRVGVAQTLQYGTLVRHRVRAAYTDLHALEQQVGRPMLGILGVEQLDAFETVLDYRTQHLHFIPVDTAGHRLIPNSWAPATDSIPMLVESQGSVAQTALEELVVQAAIGGTTFYLLLDTGSPDNFLKSALQRRISTHLTDSTLYSSLDSALSTLDSTKVEPRDAAGAHAMLWSVDSLAVNHWVYPALRFAVIPPRYVALQHNILGYPFLNTVGVVGLNVRAHQLYVYATSPVPHH